MKAVSGSQTALRRANRRLRKARKNWCCVYGLTDIDGRIRYIGQTRLLLSARLRWHWKNSVAGRSPLATWLRAQPREAVSIVAIEDNATWDVSEIIQIERYVVAYGRDLLLNVTRGGRDTPHDARKRA